MDPPETVINPEALHEVKLFKESSWEGASVNDENRPGVAGEALKPGDYKSCEMSQGGTSSPPQEASNSTPTRDELTSRSNNGCANGSETRLSFLNSPIVLDGSQPLAQGTPTCEHGSTAHSSSTLRRSPAVMNNLHKLAFFNDNDN